MLTGVIEIEFPQPGALAFVVGQDAVEAVRADGHHPSLRMRQTVLAQLAHYSMAHGGL